MSNTNQINTIENRIFEYKLKEIRAYKKLSFIIEVNGKTVCIDRNQTKVLVNEPFPTEFNNVELHQVLKSITGAEARVYPVREWYKKQLQKLSFLLRMEVAI